MKNTHKNINLNKQYNNFADKFSHNHSIGENSNNQNRLEFYKFFKEIPSSGKEKLLDLCCGDGYDAQVYKEKGFDVDAIDASDGLIAIAKEKYSDINFQVGLAENIPYKENTFDIVTSKYAIMTSSNMNPIFNEVSRVLKKDGYFLYLMTHPFRQYFEKRNSSADYFEQEVVVSNILNNSVTLHEPSHTFNEYFNKEFFNKFELINFKECFDPAAEKIDERMYPGYFIVLCKKK